VPSGAVVIAGGSDATGPLRSGFVITPTVPPKVQTFPMMLSAARVGHTATPVGNDVLVCGGADASGAPQASCDLVDGTTFAIKQTVAIAAGRRNHVAVQLSTTNVLIAGGLLADGTPTYSIEIYTPTR
jgi:hypothetical protein